SGVAASVTSSATGSETDGSRNDGSAGTNAAVTSTVDAGVSAGTVNGMSTESDSPSSASATAAPSMEISTVPWGSVSSAAVTATCAVTSAPASWLVADSSRSVVVAATALGCTSAAHSVGVELSPNEISLAFASVSAFIQLRP